MLSGVVWADFVWGTLSALCRHRELPAQGYELFGNCYTEKANGC